MKTSPAPFLVEATSLAKYFDIAGKGKLHAVDDISFTIKQGETLGLVGESGCGKSTTGRVILRLLEPTRGEVAFNGRDVFKMPPKELREARREMQMIFQDPYSCLNPRKTVRQLITEPLMVQNLSRNDPLWQGLDELMHLTGITPEITGKFPHELDGGRRQRVGIMRSLVLRPSFIVCDEPVSSLDVSIQAQILNLLQDLQERMNLTYLFISHDLSVVKHVSQRIAVMYLGRIVEEASSDDLFDNPIHPYTQALLSAIPSIDRERRRERIILSGEVPSPINPLPICRFATRCPSVQKICMEQEPEIKTAGERRVACHLA